MTAGGDRERPLVLVADDDEDILSLVSLQLERASMDVIQARDGDEALSLALTARAGGGDAQYGYQVGADDYIKKPFSPAELRGRVEELLGRDSGPE
jgi:DNA-binding response OmpR family regulator